MVGSPFSPAYATKRRRGEAARAIDHAAMNVAIYGPGARRWALTERGIAGGDRTASALTLGASAMWWEGGALRVRLDERSAVLGRPIRGALTLRPTTPPAGSFALDGAALHHWWPIAPSAAIEVELDEPRLRFRGHGYHDANAGDVALEASFARWCWARGPRAGGGAFLTYDTVELGGRRGAIALAVDGHGAVMPLASLADRRLRPTLWALGRRARSDEDGGARVVRTLEDTPFYARSLVAARLAGEEVVAMHEAISLSRLRSRLVQTLIPYRMRRADAPGVKWAR